MTVTPGSGARRSANRTVLAAAKINLPSSKLMSIEDMTAFETSFSAAKATCPIMALSRPASSAMGVSTLRSIPGMTGNSRGSTPRIFVLLPSQVRFSVCDPVGIVRLSAPCGSKFTMRVSNMAGNTVVPSCWICASIQTWMPISRLVAETRSRPPSVATRIPERMGTVLRSSTAFLTTLSACAKSSCLQVSFNAGVSSLCAPGTVEVAG